MKLRNIGKAYYDSERTTRKTGWSNDIGSAESLHEFNEFGFNPEPQEIAEVRRINNDIFNNYYTERELLGMFSPVQV